jgi:drug/metabolite transporter (DMT)-like permease
MALFFWIATAMVAFAANSLFCRLALSSTSIDPVSFTTLRLCFGAVTLLLLSSLRRVSKTPITYRSIFSTTSVKGGISLFLYALCFSIAYVSLSTGTGALILFGTVQLTMISAGLLNKERLSLRQSLGFIMAFAGVLMLLLPSATTPSISAATIMVLSGMAWGFYTLHGKKSNAPVISTTGNFVIGTLLAVAALLINIVLIQTGTIGSNLNIDTAGILYSLLSGAFASACGYVLWYHCLPNIRATTAALVQLSVPVIAIAMGILFLNEPLTLLVTMSCALTIFGIYIAREKERKSFHIR